MIEDVNNYMVAPPQIDIPHLLFQKQMQNLKRNDFDVLAIDNRTHGSLECVAFKLKR